jgi:acetyl esterase/lipase
MILTNRQNIGLRGILIFLILVASLFSTSNATAGEALKPLSCGHHTDIQYGQVDGEDLLLDAFVPEGDGLHPVVIIVHGGGWGSGDKLDMDFLFEPLSTAGFTWFSINYRLAPKHRWPGCLDDVNTAIRWVKSHASEYKGDPNRIALAGYSSGGHLVCLAAVEASPDTRVQAVVGFAAPTDLVADTQRRGGLSLSLQNLFGLPKEVDEATQNLLRNISPINYVKPPLGPFLLIHGTADQSVPYQQSINFQAKLRKEGIPCELITITGAPHRITEWEKYGVDFTGRMTEWLVKTLGNQTQRQMKKQ